MKIEPSYLIELLKKLEEIFPNGALKEQNDDENLDEYNKRFAHLIFLIDEGFIAKVPTDMRQDRNKITYRINSKGIIFLNGFDLKNHLKSH